MEKQSEMNRKEQENKPAPKKDNGRPPFKQDEKPRKKRVETPKSKPGVAETLVWLEDSWDNISSIVNAAYLGSKNKKNLRQLTKSDVSDLENLKLSVLTNTKVLSDVTNESVFKTITEGNPTPKDFKEILSSKGIDTYNLSIDEYRRKALSAFLEFLLS